MLLHDRLVTAVYRAVPFIPGIYSLAAYLVVRPSARRVVWILGFLIAAGLTAFTTVATLGSGIALSRLLAASTTLYALPMIMALATVDGSRRAQLSRWAGVLAIVVVCVVAQFVARYVSFGFLGVVDASA
jgi:drug/metabolite transporter superfamily protein YnfA